MYVGQQSRKAFGLSYQTRIGNDLQGSDLGYKIHLIYGAQAAPSERAYSTINDTPEAMTLSWELTTSPVDAGNNLKPTAQLVIDSTKVDPDDLAVLEAALYGSPGTDPRLPLPSEVLGMFSSSAVQVTTVQPSYDAGTDIITVPNVTGVVYSIDGDDVPPGPFGPITSTKVVQARPAPGFKFSPTSDNDWTINFS